MTTDLPKPWRRTPLHPSPSLSTASGCQIYLKLENLQPSTSFKSRGLGSLILHSIASHPPGTLLHFVSSSGGNAGLAAVTAASGLGYPCTVVVPESTEVETIAKLRGVGAREVLVHGRSWMEADGWLRGTVMGRLEEEGGGGGGKGVKAVYLPPFDHPEVWKGASTMLDEVAEQLGEGVVPDAVVCSVGGGGLFCGIMQGVERHGWRGKTRVVAVETRGAESLNRSLVEGRLVTLEGITSVAKSLGAVRVAERAFELGQRKEVKSVVLSDAEACMGCWRFADDERFLVEAACGASVALAYMPERLRELVDGFGPESKVVIVVCGGSRIDLDTMQRYREEYGLEIERMGLGGKGVGERDVPSTYTVE